MPGSIPDDWWAQQIAADPQYSYAKQLSDAQDAADVANRNAQIITALGMFGGDPRQALKQYGLNPSYLNDLSADEWGQAQTLAGKMDAAGLSTLSRNKLVDQDARTKIAQTLASRNILDSGEFRYQSDRQNLANTQQGFASNAQLLDYLTGFQQALLDHRHSRSQSLISAGESAAARVAKLWAGQQPTTTTTPPTDSTPPATTTVPGYDPPPGYMPGNELVPPSIAGAQTGMPAFPTTTTPTQKALAGPAVSGIGAALNRTNPTNQVPNPALAKQATSTVQKVGNALNNTITPVTPVPAPSYRPVQNLSLIAKKK